jgi:hypothetical protein
VIDANPNTKNATIREPVPPATRKATKTGTRTRRSIVSPFGKLTSLGVACGFLASELVNGPELPEISLFTLIYQIRQQVHPLRT